LQTTTTTNADSSIDPSSLIDIAFDSGKWVGDGGETAHTANGGERGGANSSKEDTPKTGETRHQSNRGGGWRRVRTRRHRRRTSRKYANSHRLFQQHNIILANIIIPSTSMVRKRDMGIKYGLQYGEFQSTNANNCMQYIK
jgi:hypothetical protein